MTKLSTVPQPYITRASHGPYPAGTPCEISVDDAGLLLVLKFSDGETIELSRFSWFAHGMEEISDRAFAILSAILSMKLTDALDQEVLNELEEIAGGKGEVP